MKKILVVDDEKEVRELFCRALASAHYTTESAASGEEALRIIENENFYLLFFDLNMPGMNGIELCRRVRKLQSISIIFAITGYASMFHLHECREAGFDDYFIKPVSIRTLLDETAAAFKKIDRWLERTK
ncbi:MAG: response regulator [Deltaproteobacteria bacterium]|nr:response regulator [Deltaproteobacteria bacterium]